LDLAAASFLCLLTFAAILPRSKSVKRFQSLPQYAIIVPAHNEEQLIATTLANLLCLDYPRENYRVHVIADNCSDATVDIARQFDVSVHERVDPEHPGKGQALSWFLEKALQDRKTQAFVFIDADSIVDPEFLTVMAEHIDANVPKVLQASYRVNNPTQSALTSLRAIAFGLMHELRGRGKAGLRLSAGLWGNGMVFSRPALLAVPWSSFAAVEDAEHHIQLLLNGIKVSFVADTHVYGHMPSSLSAAKGQQKRWEGGRLFLLRTYWRQLLTNAVLRRRPASAVVLAELLLPPLSVLVAFSVALLLATGLIGARAEFMLACISLTEIGAYIAGGLIAARLPVKAYGALFYAPFYIAWKVWLFAGELPNRAGPAWLRTTRA
jgi:cellulose synthase/poly-beta-1,6-N-acetylglucosamine synthase-like glycosyltransferase